MSEEEKPKRVFKCARCGSSPDGIDNNKDLARVLFIFPVHELDPIFFFCCQKCVLDAMDYMKSSPPPSTIKQTVKNSYIG